MKLRKHQKEALIEFNKYFYEEERNRGILSMCCASGKTFTFYSMMKLCIIEKKESLFMYVTSRILLVQDIVYDLVKWLCYDDLDLKIYVKVSDFNIQKLKRRLDEDVYLKNNSHLSKKINNYLRVDKNNIINLTDIGDIRDRLNSNYIVDKKKILIITTYESSLKIAGAISTHNKNQYNSIIVPDLLVLDEAHNLVSDGKNGEIKISSGLLDSSNENKEFNPSKYLFMTATPLKIIKRDAHSSYKGNDITYSMDNRNTYGDVFYEYTFSEGIRDGYIVNFDVVYLDDSRGQLKLQKKPMETYEQTYVYFTCIARLLLMQIEKYSLKHIIVYLLNQEKASCLRKIINNEKKDRYIEAYCVVSSMSKKEKDDNINNFKKFTGMPKILLSVDIFNEGIDIPICDSILFAEERNSETTIVQNIGRALRLYNNEYNKKRAYVILPTKIYNIDSDDISSKYSSRFKKIREICDILREDPLQGQPHYYKRTTKGNTKSFTNKNEDSHVDQKSERVEDIVKLSEKGTKSNDKILSEHSTAHLENTVDQIMSNLEIGSTNSYIGNTTLQQLKELVKKHKITTLYQLYKLTQKIISTDIPHKHFKSDWVCYGDLLFDKVYTYDQARCFMKNIDMTNIKCVDDWLSYYDNIIIGALRDEKYEPPFLNEIIYVPYNPKTYYLIDWDNNGNHGWESFLGKKLESLVGLEIKTNNCSSLTNADKNIQNIVNNDKYKIQSIPMTWQTFYGAKTNLVELNKWISNNFRVDCKFTPRFRLNKNLRYDSGIINAWVDGITDVPITVDIDCKVMFDRDISDMKTMKNKKIVRCSSRHICDSKVIEEVESLFYEIKKSVADMKK